MLTAPYLASSCAFRREFRSFGFEDHSEIQPIDAPMNIAAGSHEHYDYLYADGWTVLPTSFSRDE